MTSPVSRARASKELGELFAEALQEADAHQVGVCAKLGILDYMHFDWMRARAKPGSDVAEYKLAVLRGLDEQRKRDLKAIDKAIDDADSGHCATVWNVRKHRHESRFKRFYDDPVKHEVSGPNGGAVQHAVMILPANGREPSAAPDAQQDESDDETDD